MSEQELGRGGFTSVFAYTFWYGFLADPLSGLRVPVVAYHPSIRGRSVEYEARTVLKKFGVRRNIAGIRLRNGTPAHIRYANIKLWGRWSSLGLHLSLCETHPVDPTIVGHEVASGFVKTTWQQFLEFSDACKVHGGLALTLLDDRLERRFDLLNMQLEWCAFDVHKTETPY